MDTWTAIFSILFLISVVSSLVCNYLWHINKNRLRNAKWDAFSNLEKYRRREKTLENLLIVSIVCLIIFGCFMWM